MSRPWLVLCVLLAGVLLAPTVWAQDGSLYVDPATPEAESVRSLFVVTLVIATIVFVLVEGLLFYVLWRGRRTKHVPRDETHRGHVTAEIVWTIIPALILLGLGVASAGTLFRLDDVPDDADIVVKVNARQFVWTFDYSENPGFDRNTTRATTNELRVQSGSTVRLDVRGLDVIHSFFVPEFALKIDAFPDRITHQWFTAPAPGTYPLQCTEFCGAGHHLMQGNIVVFPAGEQPVPYGTYRAPAATNATG